MSRQWFGGRATRAAAVLMAASALAFGASACGDDEDEGEDAATTEEAAAVEEVTVVATEYDFELSATPTAETKTITFDNQGEDPHVLVYGRINEGFTLDEAVQLGGRKGSALTLAQTEAKPGESTTVELERDVDPGSYVMLCPIEGKEGLHYKLGQLEEFEIG